MKLLRIGSAIILICSVAACIEMKNVSVFASSVTTVTTATNTMIEADRSVCKTTNETLSEVSKFPGVGAMANYDCVNLNKVLDSISGVNLVLENYGKALHDISEDTFIGYDSDSTALQSTLKALPTNIKPSDDKIAAVSGLASWIASVETQDDREKAVEAAMSGNNGEMKENFHKVVALLSELSKQYEEALTTNARITQASIGIVKHDFARCGSMTIVVTENTGKTSGSATPPKCEPVAVEEMTKRLTANLELVDGTPASLTVAQMKAITDYRNSLDAMSKAFDAASQKQTSKQLLPEVITFAKQARTVSQSVQKAFPL